MCIFIRINLNFCTNTRLISSRYGVTDKTIQNTKHSLVNSHISMPSGQFSHFRDKMSLARDTVGQFRDDPAILGRLASQLISTISSDFERPLILISYDTEHCTISSWPAELLVFNLPGVRHLSWLVNGLSFVITGVEYLTLCLTSHHQYSDTETESAYMHRIHRIQQTVQDRDKVSIEL